MMISFNLRWLCGRQRQTRKFGLVLVTTVVFILFVFEQRNLSVDLRDENVDFSHAFLSKAFDRNDSKPPENSEARLHISDKRWQHSEHSTHPRTTPAIQKASDTENRSSTTRNSHLNSENALHRQSNKSRRHMDAFGNRMTGEEKAVVFQILQALEMVSAKYDFPYFLCGGTLLGSYRHHDLIPWDDDVDVYMNLTEREDIYSGLATLSPSFEVFSAGHRIKLYSQLSKPSSRFPWNYPYVDINFFVENATHISDSDPVFGQMAYHKDTIFPLHRRPLGGLSPFAPFDTFSYLSNTYSNLTHCSTSHYDHRTETYLGEAARIFTRCRSLRHRYPFVYRSVDTNSSTRETLKIGDTELHTVVVDDPQSTIGDPFALLESDRSPSEKVM